MRSPSVILLLFVMGTISARASAAFPAWLPDCGCAPRAEVVALREQIAAAGSLDEAQTLALAPAHTAHGVVRRARWLASGSENLARADATLEAYERSVAAAETPEQVALHYAGLVRLDPGTLGSASGFMEHCSYSTGEIIAIVLGFILGIIPGIILLILLC